MAKSEPTVRQLFDLTGKVALVTGGTGYLGTAFSLALAEAGASVVISSRERERARAAAEDLPTAGSAQHVGVQLDHMEADSVEAGFAEAVDAAGEVDVLVNNGNEGQGNDLTQVTHDQFTHQLGNASGYFDLARRLRDHAVERNAQASVIMIGSMYGQVASYPDAYAGVCNASPVGYHALKGGIIHMTRHLAVYWAQDGVRVNCLSPGPFPNSRTVPEGLVPRLCEKSPMKRMGKPHELKGAVVFLASDASSYMTGQNVTIDGGWTAW
ncbi:MAG: SDR family oxidoreductase [Candidatus Latescibacteria bacterium]|jgi:gluconate 5-dehydrogenase|nr:SDR family oxidoreductase [Candidatus Latescibacterota bacterium]